MNTKIKVAAGVIAGLIAGTTLMGTAVAAPRLVAAPAAYGYGMMRSFETSGALVGPTLAEMQSLMNRYRTSSGGIDVARMRIDVASGKVTPPCFSGTKRSGNTAGLSVAPTSPRRAYGMMPRTAPNSGYGPGMMRGITPGTGYGRGMMGGTY